MEETPWYHSTNVYQIYPRSFFDTNGDGIGDLPGIIQKLDYLKNLGVETIWCSPFYSSPQQDFGYDISDYCDISPDYGTMSDARKLIAEVHQRGMRIIFDMVMNHTSLEHPWFKESASSTINAKADWYIWRDKPTAWQSLVGGGGWHYCAARKQYYWASFLPFQPDLNYRNPEVKKQMLEVVRFWLRQGVDGFRLDIFNAVYKDDKFRNGAAVRREVARQGFSKQYIHSVNAHLNLPESIAFAKELRSVCDSFGDKMLLGEIYGNHAVIKNYLGQPVNDGLGLVFHFEMLRFRFSASYFRRLITSLEKDFPQPYTPVYVFSNHDRRRSMTRLHGNFAKAKLLHLLQLTARGVPCLYYGEELGMTDGKIPYAKGLDPVAQKYKWVPRFLTNLADETLNRDEVRTPMMWDSTAQAGFSTNPHTWLPVNKGYKTVNVQRALSDNQSLWHTVQAVLQLRNKYTALRTGSLSLLPPNHCPKGVLAFERTDDKGNKLLVVLNYTKKIRQFTLPSGNFSTLFSIDSVLFKENKITLSPYNGIILAEEKK